MMFHSTHITISTFRILSNHEACTSDQFWLRWRKSHSKRITDCAQLFFSRIVKPKEINLSLFWKSWSSIVYPQLMLISRLNFIEDHNIELIHVCATKINNDITLGGRLTEDHVITSLEILLNRDNYPCHILCNLGRHKTGTVVGTHQILLI